MIEKYSSPVAVGSSDVHASRNRLVAEAHLAFFTCTNEVHTRKSRRANCTAILNSNKTTKLAATFADLRQTDSISDSSPRQ